jgi:Predicted membrane protein
MAAITKPESVSWKEILHRTFKEANQDDILGRSAQLSYYFFLALFPMLISIIAVMSVFGHADYMRQKLLDFLTIALPGSASELIQKTLLEVIQGAGGLKMSFGILFSLWSASAGMSAIMDTLNAEYEVSEGRSFIRRSATAVGLSIVCATLMVCAVTIVLAGGSTAQAFSFGMSSVLLRMALWPIALGLVLLAFALIYYFAPDIKDQKWHWVTPGALVGLALWLLVSFALKAYLHYFDRYSATYGSLGAVIVLLLWFYLSGASVLMGAEINSVLENAAADAGEPDAKHEGEKAPDQKAAAARAG